MSGVMGKFLVTGIVLSSIVACSNSSSDGGGNLRDKKVISYNTKSCEFSLNQGDSAKTWLLGTRDVKTAYFGKEFNRAYLDAVSTASVSETIHFVNQTGATVYKSSLVDTKDCSSSLFASADSMPSDIENKWNESTKTDDDSDSFVLGLYLPKTDSAKYPSLTNGAAIIVRENTNRWTVVHEFMHHLFMLRASEQGYDETTARMNYIYGLSELQTIAKRKDLSDAEKALALVEPLKKYVAGLDSMMIHFTLEEMTIEATLKDSLAGGQLQYVPKNSNWYINKSAETAVEQYQNPYDLAKNIRDVLSADKISERAAMDSIVNLVLSRYVTMSELIRKYPMEKQTLQGGMLLLTNDQHTGCSHAAEVQEILKEGAKIGLPTFPKN
jgi:hypothetical protein